MNGSFEDFCRNQLKRIRVSLHHQEELRDYEEGRVNQQELAVESRGARIHATGKRKPHMDDQALTNGGSFPYSRRKETVFVGYERKAGRVPKFRPELGEDKDDGR